MLFTKGSGKEGLEMAMANRNGLMALFTLVIGVRVRLMGKASLHMLMVTLTKAYGPTIGLMV